MSRFRWSGIVVLIAGIAFWVREPFTPTFQAERWWALLLLVPVMSLFLRKGGDTERMPGSDAVAGLGGGPGRGRMAGAILGVMAVFLLAPNFGIGWPLLLVVYGLAAALA